MSASPDRWSENNPLDWSEILGSCKDFKPEYPEKACLPLIEFKEFYFNDEKFKDLSRKEKLFLAARDVMAGFYTFARENNIYYGSPSMHDAGIMKIFKSYYKKFLFFKEQFE